MPWTQIQRSQRTKEVDQDKGEAYISSCHCFRGYQLYIAEALCALEAYDVNYSKTSRCWIYGLVSPRQESTKRSIYHSFGELGVVWRLEKKTKEQL
jgi:hypothetical protein